MSSSRATGGQWNEDRFFKALEKTCSKDAIKDVIEVAEDILCWVQTSAADVWWGEGNIHGAFGGCYDVGDREQTVFVVYIYGKVEIYLDRLVKKPPFEEESKRLELLDSLKAIEGFVIQVEDISKRPYIWLKDLACPKRRVQFKDAIDWLVNEIRTSA